jgi:hypothetical protein
MSDRPAPVWERALPFGPTGSSAIVESADYAIQRLRALGVTFPDSSRLVRARAYVQAAQDDIASAPSGEVLAEATRTIFEFYLICRAFGAPRADTDPRLLESLAVALGGPDLPGDEDDATSLARNIQFELYVGAWLTAGGVRVALAEPDLQVEYDGRLLGVAAKRVRSRSRIMRRIAEASRQILMHGTEGFIAMNVDHLLDELPLVQDEAERGRYFDRSFPEFGKVMKSFLRRPHVRGLLVVGHQARWITEGKAPRVDVGAFTKFHLITDTDEERRKGDRFLEDLKNTQAARLASI